METRTLIRQDYRLSSSMGSRYASKEMSFFIDYGNSASVHANTVVQRLLSSFKNDLRVVVKHQPNLSVHISSEKAAEACVGAALEQLFLLMHEKLLANRERLGVIGLSVCAKEIGVQNENFLEDLVYGVYKPFVEQDTQEAARWPRHRAPFFVVDGSAYAANTDLEILRRMIQKIEI